MIVIRQCKYCGAKYNAEQRYLDRGQGLFCSISCSSSYHQAIKPKPEPNVFCALCQTPFYLNNSKQKNSRSGLFFCTRDHKDLAQRIGGIEAIMPPHYSDGMFINYRKLAFESLPNECAVCGWDECLEVLEVNHKDLNRSNNNVENLEILCPTHHQVFHFLDKSGRWASRSGL